MVIHRCIVSIVSLLRMSGPDMHSITAVPLTTFRCQQADSKPAPRRTQLYAHCRCIICTYILRGQISTGHSHTVDDRKKSTGPTQTLTHLSHSQIVPFLPVSIHHSQGRFFHTQTNQVHTASYWLHNTSHDYRYLAK